MKQSIYLSIWNLIYPLQLWNHHLYKKCTRLHRILKWHFACVQFWSLVLHQLQLHLKLSPLNILLFHRAGSNWTFNTLSILEEIFPSLWIFNKIFDILIIYRFFWKTSRCCNKSLITNTFLMDRVAISIYNLNIISALDTDLFFKSCFNILICLQSIASFTFHKLNISFSS